LEETILEGRVESPSRRYLLVTPCRNEQDYLPITIESVARQSVLPACWIIVDDGSTDRTPDILREAAARYSFIKVLPRTDRGERAVGPGVIQAFNEGLATVDLDDYDYLCKLDADLGIPPTYFETMMQEMEADPLIGNLSGKTYVNPSGTKWVVERMGNENAIGAAKFYRRECYIDIGGFVPQASWDGIDGHQCRMKGWIAGSIDRPEVRLEHYRPQGSSQRGIWTGRKRWGRGKYFMGSSLVYVAAVSVYRAMEYPYVLGGLGILIGYIEAALSRTPRYGDKAYLKYFRRYELESLIRGKRRTLEKYNAMIRAKAEQGNDPRLRRNGARFKSDSAEA